MKLNKHELEDMYKYKMNMYCFWDEQQVQRMQITMMVFLSWQMLVCVLLIRRAAYKIHIIKEPIQGVNYQETYCSISLNIISWVRFLLLLSFVRFFWSLIEYAQGSNYRDLSLPKNFVEPQSNDEFNIGWTRATYQLLLALPSDYCFNYIMILQIQEWKSMLLIIKSQLGRKNEEILFALSHEEGVSRPVSPFQLAGIHLLSLHKDFCKREKIMAVRFLILRYGFTLLNFTQALVFMWENDNFLNFQSTYQIVLAVVIITSLALNLGQLMYLMRTYHSFEYNLHKRSVLSIGGVLMIICSFHIIDANEYSELNIGGYLHLNYITWTERICGYDFDEQGNVEIDTSPKSWFKVLVFIAFKSHVLDILVCFLMIAWKNRADVL